MDLGNINFTSLAGLTAIGAIVATTWRHIATFGRYILGIFIGTSIVKEDLGSAVMAFSLNKSIRSPIGMRFFGGCETYVHPRRHVETVAYEGLSTDPILIKYGRRFALVSLGGTGDRNNDMIEMQEKGRVVKIKYFRWFFNIEKFLIEAVEYYNGQKRQNKEQDKKQERSANRLLRFKIKRYSGRGYGKEGGEKSSYNDSPVAPSAQAHSALEQYLMSGVYRLLNWTREDLQIRPEEGHSPFTGYPFPPEVGDAIKELKGWLANEKWFRSKSIPWRRGWLLHGIPGTGKSTLVRALGMSFDLPVCIFDLAGMTNDDLTSAWDDMMTNTPCIALIEDMDTIFDGRKYVGSTNPNVAHLTFDCLLNCISGVKQADGVFLVITTNHLDKIDSAIGVPDKTGKSSRPGRIDKAIHLGIMQQEQRLSLAKHILSDYPELVEETVSAGEGETAAQFQSRCADLALTKFWADGKFLENLEDKYEEVMHFGTAQKKIKANTLYGRTAPSPIADKRRYYEGA